MLVFVNNKKLPSLLVLFLYVSLPCCPAHFYEYNKSGLACIFEDLPQRKEAEVKA